MDYTALFLAPFQSAVEAFRLAAKSLDRIATVMEKEQALNAANTIPVSARAESAIVAELLAEDKHFIRSISSNPTPPLSPSRPKVRKTPSLRGQR